MQHCLFKLWTPIEEVNRRIAWLYGPLCSRVRLDPLSHLIRSLIGSQTRDKNSDRAFDNLREHLHPWEALLTASDRTLLRCLEPVTYADRKAAQLRGAMRMIEGRVGTLRLDFLGERPVEDAQAWLRTLPGVDMKVSAAVLNASTLRKRVLVVDCHHFRVARRLGLLRPTTRFAAAQRVLMSQHVPDEWSADDLDDHHCLMKVHGQRVCFHARPHCWKCCLQDICPVGIEQEWRAAAEPSPLSTRELHS